MLSFLQIRDFTIIDELDLEFAEGFTCISGETGAGKSILVGALSLLCGSRADSGAVRSGAERAELIAGFELSAASAALGWLQAADLDDGNDCLLRRTISAGGRSRNWINGSAVTLQQLAELGDLLVELHGQNEHLRLTRRDEAFRLLDEGSEYHGELQAVADCHRSWHELEQERQQLLQERPLGPGEIELLQHQVAELEAELLTAGQFAELEREYRVLARGGEIAARLEETLQSLDNDQFSAGELMHRAADLLAPHSALDPDLDNAVGLLREAAIQCDEARRSLESARARLDLSPDRLAEVQQRLSAQHDLARKHRVQPEQLEDTLERLRERCEQATTLDSRLGSIDERLAAADDLYRQAAEALHERRLERAGALAAAVTDLMQQLGMEGGTFAIAVEFDPDGRPASRGSDRLELRVSANPGAPPGPLRKVASGGELSRLGLAIKVAARSGPAPAVQIFDEVDAGIGGETAHAVGALLKGLAAGGQALCVTHLAQVAVFADHQLQVLKALAGAAARVEASQLSGEERVDEIARMLGGKLSARSRAHASELLSSATLQH
jgi:DNA repair protein RecN (Recombination protein N)